MKSNHLIRVALLSCVLGVTGCTYEHRLRQLPPEEQTDFRVYHQVMTSQQARTYLAQPTPATRQRYLQESGLLARFQALTPQDQDIVRSGQLQIGASAEALRFLWGDPYYKEGREEAERWFYVGSSLSLAERGSDSRSIGTQVVVHFDEGRVVDWLDFVPSTHDDAGESKTIR